jgi:hypothetical protein
MYVGMQADIETQSAARSSMPQRLAESGVGARSWLEKAGSGRAVDPGDVSTAPMAGVSDVFNIALGLLRPGVGVRG